MPKGKIFPALFPVDAGLHTAHCSGLGIQRQIY